MVGKTDINNVGKTNAERGQANQNTGIWSRESFTFFFTIEQVSCSIDTNSLMVFREEFLNVTFWWRDSGCMTFFWLVDGKLTGQYSRNLNHQTSGSDQFEFSTCSSVLHLGWGLNSYQFSSVQSLSHVWLFETPWIPACQDSLSITNSRSLTKLMPIETVMPSNHLNLCRPLLLLPPIPPNIRVFSNESTLCMRWPSIGVSASTSVLPMNTQDWSPLEWTGWIFFQSKGLSRVFSNITVQKHPFFSAQLYSSTLTSINNHWKNHSLD